MLPARNMSVHDYPHLGFCRGPGYRRVDESVHPYQYQQYQLAICTISAVTLELDRAIAPGTNGRMLERASEQRCGDGEE